MKLVFASSARFIRLFVDLALTYRRRVLTVCLGLLIVLMGLGGWTPAAWAGLTDDNYDGNIYPLYAGNGAIVPPRVTLEASIKQGKPAVVVFYVDDSKDCKQFSTVVSQLEGFYGRAANFIPVIADAIPVKSNYDKTEPGYYFEGQVPHTVIFNQAGDVVLNEIGNIDFEPLDDVMREVFNLLPRSESVELKRRVVNEVNTELVIEDQTKNQD